LQTIEYHPSRGTREWLDKSQPMGRTGTSDECAQAILFLASQESSFITNTPFIVDGGPFFS
jgi:NAD(P)-dependent dehydrogenase (short-subunit alcohol dehydrogenase family)